MEEHLSNQKEAKKKNLVPPSKQSIGELEGVARLLIWKRRSSITHSNPSSVSSGLCKKDTFFPLFRTEVTGQWAAASTGEYNAAVRGRSFKKHVLPALTRLGGSPVSYHYLSFWTSSRSASPSSTAITQTHPHQLKVFTLPFHITFHLYEKACRFSTAIEYLFCTSFLLFAKDITEVAAKRMGNKTIISLLL